MPEPEVGENTSHDIAGPQAPTAFRAEALPPSIQRLEREQRLRAEDAVLLELHRRGEDVYPDLVGLLDLPCPDLD